MAQHMFNAPAGFIQPCILAVVLL